MCPFFIKKMFSIFQIAPVYAKVYMINHAKARNCTLIEREKLISMVCSLKNGEPDAATELFETCHKDIYYFILKTVDNDHHLAEDLTQDTFVSILEKISSLEEPAAFVSWSKQIAYHKCTDYFDKKKELLADENEDGYSVFDTVEEDREEFIPDAAINKEDLRKTIIAMINDLPEDQKSAIILRYFNEIPVKEIASIQGVSEGTVKSRLNYGRKAIKQSVEAYEKKNDIKLHCAGVIPLLLWLFKMYRIENGLSITSNTASGTFAVAEGSVAASTTMASGAATTATATATSTAVNTAAGVGAKALAAKVIAVIAAAAITVGGVIIATNSKDEAKPIESPQESWSTEASIPETSTEPLATAEATQAATEEVTEETQIPTEPPTEATTVPTTETTEPETTSPTPETTEPPTTEADPTDATTEPTEGATELPLPTEDSDHNETDPSVNPEECSHDWEYTTNVYLTTINEVRECRLCGSFELLDAYSNNCEHDFQVDSSWINDFGEECFSYKCVKCGSGSLG